MALMKKLTSAIVASSLVLGLVGTAGATTPDKVQSAADRMFKLGLVNGVTPGAVPPDMALNANLTRAQLVTILVRAFGQENNSKYLAGSTAFPDSANHWASGYIAMAKQIIAQRTAGREVVGMPDGTFSPDGNVTAAEAVAFLMKFVGAPQDSTLAWPDNYIQGAANAGLITAEDKAVLVGIKNAPATRGLAFYLADRTFYGYKIAEGGTVYTTFVDNIKPALTVDAVPATTLEEQLIVTGTVANDAVAVHVGSMDNVATVANGKFTATVKLTVGENNILVNAVDLAGNSSEQTVKVTKTVGTAASIDAADITVGAGEAVDLKAAVKDAKGNVIADAVITGESTVGTFANGKFTAGEKAGEGTVTLKSGELTKEVKVTVTAGALAKVTGETPSVAPGKALKLVATDKFGNTVTGATFSKGAEGGVVDGDTFIATKEGTYTVKATKGDISVEGKIGVYGTVTKLIVTAPETVIANNSSSVEIKVAAVDKNGSIVGDFTNDITLEVPQGFNRTDDVLPEVKDGVVTFHYKATADLANSIIDIYAKDSTDPTIKGEASLTAEAQKATSISVDAPDYLPTNAKDAAQIVTVKVLDQAGKKMLTGSWDMDVAVTGPARLENGVKSDTVSITPAANTFEVRPDDRGTTGTVDITVSFAGLTAGKDTMKAAFAAAAKAITVTGSDTVVAVDTMADAEHDENYVEYTVKLVDQNGVPVTDTAADRQVKLSFSAGSGSRTFVSTKAADGGWTAFDTLNNSSQLVEIVNGVGMFRLASNRAQVASFTVADASGALTAAAKTDLTSNAGEPAVLALGSAALNVKLADSAKGDVVAQLYDRFGNVSKTAGVKLTFKVGAGDKSDYEEVTLNGASEAQDVRTDANGQAKVTVGITAAAPQNGVEVSVKGEYNGTELVLYTGRVATDWPAAYTPTLAETTTVKMVARVADTIRATFSVPNYTVGAPAGFDMVLTVKDNYGKPMTDLTDTDFRLTASSGSMQSAINNGTVHLVVNAADADLGIYRFTGFKPVATGTLTITAEVASAATTVKTQRSITVNAAAASAFDVAEQTAYDGTNDKIVVETGKATPFTIELLDASGNLAGAYGKTIRVDLSVLRNGVSTNGRPVYVDFRDASGASIDYIDLSAGRTTAKFYVVTNAEGAQIELSAKDAGPDGKINEPGDNVVFGSPVTLDVNPIN